MNIEIYKENFTVIMGSSGSGKSTLLYSLSTMDNPASGKISLLGKDISAINEKEASKIRSKNISFIFHGSIKMISNKGNGTIVVIKIKN